MSKLTITISGPVGSGKTCLYAVIERALRDHGVKVEHADKSLPWRGEVDPILVYSGATALEKHRPAVVIREELLLRPDPSTLSAEHCDQTHHVHCVNCPRCRTPLQFPAMNSRLLEPNETVPLWRCNGCGHLYSDKISQCDCMTDRCQDFTPYLALLVEVRP